MQKPQSVITAVYAILITLGLDLFVTGLSNSNGADSMSGTIAGSVISLAVYGLLCIQISRGRNWARNVYAVLLAAEVAGLFAFENKDASDIEIVVSYLMVPVEGWILFQLFRAESAEWFNQKPMLQQK